MTKWCMLFIILLAMTTLTLSAQKVQNDSLATVLIQMKEADQEIRKLFPPRWKASQGHLDSVMRVAAERDMLHGIKLHAIIDSVGYPGKSLVGMEACHAFWVLVMHQDDDVLLQKEVLKWMWSVMDEGEVIDRDVAFLDDRVAINEGRCQTYATQNGKRSEAYPRGKVDICDVKKLKRNRKKMSLKPMDKATWKVLRKRKKAEKT